MPSGRCLPSASVCTSGVTAALDTLLYGREHAGSRGLPQGALRIRSTSSHRHLGQQSSSVRRSLPQDLNVDVMQERRQLVLSVPGEASRMRACARDTASRLCVRTVLCSTAFSLARPFAPRLRSGEALCSLASRYFGRSTSPSRSLSYGLRPSQQRPGHDWRDGDGDLPVPCKRLLRMPGSTTTRVGMCLAISTPAVLPSVGRKTSAPRLVLRRSIPRLRPPL